MKSRYFKAIKWGWIKGLLQKKKKKKKKKKLRTLPTVVDSR